MTAGISANHAPQAASRTLRSPGDAPHTPSPVAFTTKHQTRLGADRDPALRRGINVALAALAIVLLLPVFAIVALLVRLSSPGPIIYSQVRVGLDRRRSRAGGDAQRRALDIGGRAFTIYKFRTMRVDAETGTGAVWATTNDSRVTPIGKVLRQYRLDEIPQLVNVLLGDMNIVGPRPERPTIFAQLREEVEGYQLRQLARPGITGLAQVSQAYDTCLEDVRQKVRYDVEYVRDSSTWDDLRIMAKTIPVILFKKGGW